MLKPMCSECSICECVMWSDVCVCMCECVCVLCKHVSEGVYMCPCVCQSLWVVARYTHLERF